MHGLGGAKDLPIPLGLAVAGAAAALVVSFCVLALAWRTPRYQQEGGRPAPRWLARTGRRPPVPVDGAHPRPAVLRLRHLGADLGSRPHQQPGPGHVLRAGLGGHGPGLAAVRPHRPGGQPGAHAQPPAGQGHRRRPGCRGGCLPRPPRLLAGGAGVVRVRLAGAGQPAERLPGFGADLAGGVPRGHAGRRRGLRRRVVRARRPVRGLLQPARQAVALGAHRRAGWWCAARWPTWGPPSPAPGWWPWSRCCSARPRSTATRTRSSGSASCMDVGLNEIVHQLGGAAGVLPRRGRDVHRRRDVDGRGDDRPERRTTDRAAGPAGALGDPDHRGLHDRALPQLSRSSRARPR